MTGTGTSADPFIIESWDEFKAGFGTTLAETLYYSIPEGTVWDMNELEPNGVPSILIESRNSGSKIYIYCNGCKIINARISPNVSFLKVHNSGYTYIYNLYVENFYNQGIVFGNPASGSGFNYGHIYIYDSVFSGISSGSVFSGTHYMYIACYLRRCSINVELTNGYLSEKGSVRCTDSHIRLTTKNTYNQLPRPWYKKYQESSSYAFNWSFNNCLIELDIEGNGVDNTFFQYGCYTDYTNNIIKARGKDYTIITCLDNNNKIQIINTENNIKTLYTNETHASEGDGVVDEPINSKEVTEEQLHDTPYLRSLGFPIGVD